jgi:outer membrane protein assembly factor BamD
MKSSLNNYILLVVLITVIACSGYERLLKSSDYALKYQKAFEYFEKEDYMKASTLFDQISNVYRGTNKADSVYFYQALTYYQLGDNIIAGELFREFSTTYGNSSFREQADFYSAYCFYLQSPRPSLDQDYTYKAIQGFQLYLLKYPDSDKTDECKKIIVELKEKLIEKSYMNAKLYFDLEYYNSATIALNNSLIEFPESKFREEILFMILKSNYLYAYNSIVKKQRERYQTALDDYYSYISEFPEGQYKKEAEKIYENTSKYLNLDTKNN